MNVLLISDHYYPKISGTVSYVENTAINLAKQGLNVYLLVPSTGILNNLKEEKHSQSNLMLLKVAVSTSSNLEFNQQERTVLCNWIQKNILSLSKNYTINIVHLLSGLFIASILNTKELKKLNIKTFHTIHNVPPLECSNSWRSDEMYLYLKDSIRKIGVKFINKLRIKKNKFDYYIVPSNIVKEELSKYIEKSKIHVIGHGGAEYIDDFSKKPVNEIIKILTVGGIVPHKNQLLIPDIALYLKQQGIDFSWDIVGPIRNKRYFTALKNKVAHLKLENIISLNNDVNSSELKSFYTNADIYIQLSTEEGFCMTVLDAISYKLPVLSTPAGAIPEMLELVNGVLIDPDFNKLKIVISHYLKIIPHLTTDENSINKFKEKYSWKNSTEQLITLYNE